MNRLSLSCSGASALLLTGAADAQQAPHFMARGKMRLTASESLWTGRFSDCDLRYYVLIPDGFVAHGNRPPGHLHTIRFGLPDTATTAVVRFDDERFVSATARPNELQFKSLEEFADQALHFLGKEKSGFEVTARESSVLDGEPAVRLRVEYDDPGGSVVEEKLLAMRLGVLYEIGLRTTAEHYDSDSQNFAKVAAGFRFWRIYRCYGTNNNP